MKRILLVVFSLILILCSCESNSSIKALEIGGVADSADGGNHKSEYVPWSAENLNVYSDNKVIKTATITFNGNTYNCVYDYTVMKIYSKSAVHKYKTSDAWFELNSESGEIMSYTNLNLGNGTLKQNECKDISDNIADDYVDISACDVTITEKDDRYTFNYKISIAGVETSEYVRISVGKNGELKYFSKNMLGVFSESETTINKRILELVSEQAIGVLEEKINSIYINFDSYVIKSKIATELEDGSVAVVYTVDVNFSEETSNDTIDHTSCRTAIILK
ncbi:MAG: hypothetical protein IKC06_03865 [Clostridia bacterium]|nr:hypothetical protein [Clostridia bacterium]